MEQARLGAISTLQQAYSELQAQQQKAYNKVVDMIRKRKQQELEALEEVHKKRSEQLSDELKQAEKVYERQLNLLDDLRSNDDYQRRLQKETEIRDKLQQRIDLLALDDQRQRAHAAAGTGKTTERAGRTHCRNAAGT